MESIKILSMVVDVSAPYKNVKLHHCAKSMNVEVKKTLTSLVTEPTQGESKLDRIPVHATIMSKCSCYHNVKIVNSVAKSDHRVIIAYSGPSIIALKTKSYSVYQKKITRSKCQVPGISADC